MNRRYWAPVFIGLLVATAVAERPGFPRVRLDGPSAVSFHAETALMTLETQVAKVRFAGGESLGIVRGGTHLEMNLRWRNGRPLDGGLGDDLILRGGLDRDRDGSFEFDGVLLQGEWFPYVEFDGNRRTIRTPGQNIPRSGQEELRFRPTGGELAPFFAGKDIVVSGVDISQNQFDIEGTLSAAQTVRGACCQFPNVCSEVTELECDTLLGAFQGIGTTCLVPDSPVAIGQHRLTGRSFGGLSDAGLILDALDGTPGNIYAYSFSEPGAYVTLEYDGSVARIAGTAIGGLVDGGVINHPETVSFQVAYTQAFEAGGEISTPGDALVFGFIVRPSETLPLVGDVTGLTIDAGGQLDAGLRYLGSSRGTIRIIQAELAEALPTCEIDTGACCGFDGSCSQTTEKACDTLSSVYFGDGSTCEGDEDGDGVSDLCDICPGGDDTVDSDNDGIPNFCDSDPGLSNGGCCLPNGACIILNEEECGWNGGDYQGDGTSCWECN